MKHIMAFAYAIAIAMAKCAVQCRDLVAINEPDIHLMCAVCVNGVNGRFAYNFCHWFALHIEYVCVCVFYCHFRFMRTKESFRLNIRVFNLIWPCDKRIYICSLLDTHTTFFFWAFVFCNYFVCCVRSML